MTFRAAQFHRCPALPRYFNLGIGEIAINPWRAGDSIGQIYGVDGFFWILDELCLARAPCWRYFMIIHFVLFTLRTDPGPLIRAWRGNNAGHAIAGVDIPKQGAGMLGLGLEMQRAGDHGRRFFEFGF